MTLPQFLLADCMLIPIKTRYTRNRCGIPTDAERLLAGLGVASIMANLTCLCGASAPNARTTQVPVHTRNCCNWLQRQYQTQKQAIDAKCI